MPDIKDSIPQSPVYIPSWMQNPRDCANLLAHMIILQLLEFLYLYSRSSLMSV